MYICTLSLHACRLGITVATQGRVTADDINILIQGDLACLNVPFCSEKNLQDIRLSAKARGLVAHLLSLYYENMQKLVKLMKQKGCD